MSVPYCGSAPLPADVWSRFNADPTLIAAILVLLVAHVSLADSRARRVQALLGWSVAGLALTSPLCALSVALFSARIAQHLLLLLVAAPLVAAAIPTRVRAASLWPSALISVVALWFWHLPSPYEATFESTPVYWLMHMSLFGTATLLWHGLLRHRWQYTLEALAIGVVVSMQMSFLGALLTFASVPWFFRHVSSAPMWGLTALQDQQLGGVLMWIPGNLLLLWASVRSCVCLWQVLDRSATA